MSNFVVEFFKNGEWYYRHDIEHIDFSYDYLYQAKLQVPCILDKKVFENDPNFDLKGTYCAIVDEVNNIQYVGYVSSWTVDDVLIESVFRRLDFDIEPMTIDNTSIETKILELCQNQYTNNSDTLQNIPYITWSKGSNTTGHYTSTEVIRFNDFLIQILKQFQIVLFVNLNLNTGIITIVADKVVAPQLEIKSDIILDIKILGEATSVTNKIKYFNASNVLLGTYFLLVDNTVSTNMSDPLRIKPVNEAKKIVDETQTDFNLDEIANQDLEGNIYSQEIEFSLSTEDKLVDVKAVKIGTKIKIWTDGRNYLTIVTGISINTETKIAVFKCGMLRSDLSNLIYDKLKQKGIQ